MRNNIIFLFLYFMLSSLLTWGFVVLSPLYISQEQMAWSGAVAGGKWLIQLIAAFLFLKGKKWEFMKNIGWVCLVGSAILIPAYGLLTVLGLGDSDVFIGSLSISVVTMIVLYYRAVRKTGVSLLWFAVWLQCLAIAISLQLTVIFKVWNF